MENLDFKIFRVSNRGSNVVETVANSEYRINVPSELRIPNKIVKVEVIAGSITMNTDSTFNNYAEIGITSNLPNGFDSETLGSFNCGNYNLLYTIDTSSYDKQNTERICFQKASCSFQFLTSGLPEKLIFTSVATTGSSVLAPIVNDEYISFVLKLTYYDK
jgi:hypothetical protein|tara:strand:+ start:1065 stop:1547 length:483 start_codon:yes stop_codon:yes gene_type:complete